MGRRAGIVMLAAAICLLAAPALRSHGVTGAAAPVFIPAPPAVGDCVLEADSVTPDYQPDATVYDAYPPVAMASCDGERYGDVAAIVAAPAPLVVTGDVSYMSTEDANVGTCWTATGEYLGATALVVEGIGWSPTLFLQWTAMAAPSDLQRAGGQRWIACLAVTSPAVRLPGTLRDAVHTGTARDRTGACFSGRDDATGFTGAGCLQPHTSQLLANASPADRDIPRDQVERSCSAALAALTGLADVTAGGALTALTLVRDQRGELADGATVPAGSSFGCAVTSTDPSRTLSGGLMGLGDQPIPWS